MLEVLFPLLLCFLESLGTLLLDELHVGFESLLVVVRHDLVFLGIATGFEIFFLLLVTLSDVETVEGSLKVVYLILVGSLIAFCDFFHAVEHFLLGGIDLLGRFRSLRSLRSLSSCRFRRLCCSRFFACSLFLSVLSTVVCYGSSRCSLLLFLNSLCGIVFLRVHHFTLFKFMIRSSMAMLLHISKRLRRAWLPITYIFN